MPRPLAVLLMVVTTSLWGFAFVFQKTAMDHMGPYTFLSARFLVASLALLPVVLFELRRRRPTHRPGLDRHAVLLVGLMSIAFFVGSALQQQGLVTATVTNSGFLTSLYVLFVPLFGFLALRLRPHPVIYLGVPMALVGVYYLNGGQFADFTPGDGLVALCAVFWGAHVLLLGLTVTRIGFPVTVSAISFVIAGLASLGVALVVESPSLADMLADWPSIAYAGVLSTAVAFTFQAVAQQHVPAANAAIILSSESLFAALGGALLLGERLPPIGYAGAALIFCAIVLVELVPALRQRRTIVAEAG